MKNIQKLFHGFIVMMTILTITCCATSSKASVKFPSDFTGTWERANLEYPHTLTLTFETIKASNQASFWNIKSISGDEYTITNSEITDLNGTISIKLIGDNLEIIDAYDMSNASQWSGGENDWTGIWKRIK